MALAAAATLAAPAIAQCADSNAAAPASLARRPNIIFILADDLGYGDVGCYGQTKIATPYLDEMAAQGMRFTQAYAGSTICSPSRCCLLTGYDTGHAYIRGNVKVSLRPQDLTVEQILKAAGYNTACIGKWGVGEPGSTGTPVRKGFDYFYGYIDQTHAHLSWPTYLYRDDQRFDLPNVVPHLGRYGQGVATVKIAFAPDLCTDQVIHYIAHAPADKPFFLYVPYTPPHANDEDHSCEVPTLQPYESKDWTIGNKRYAALVTRLDGYVGRILQEVKARHMEDNTLVIFTSDNGPMDEGDNDPAFFNSSGPFRGYKRDLYEGGIREPMIAWWPGTIPSGVVTDQIFAFWDFLPTAAQLAGAPIPKGIDGLSIAPTLLGQPQTQQHEFLYWEFLERGFDQAVRYGDWKAVRHMGEPLELYNLKMDPGEKYNVANEHPEIVAKIRAYLAVARTNSPLFPIRAPRGFMGRPAPAAR
jgi:arylsulfatase A-like enzyme